MPRGVRSDPLWLQIKHHYRQAIITGEIPSGARLPAIRDIAAEWGVSIQIVQQALRDLKTAGLVEVTSQGYSADGGEGVRLTPLERLQSIATGGPLYLRTEQPTVTAAGLVPAEGLWEHVAGVLHLDAGQHVIRREQVFYTDTPGPGHAPVMLAVSWFPPEFAGPVPELVAAEPVTALAGEVGLIAERTGRVVTFSEESYRGRALMDDRREAPALRLPEGSPCLAGVYVWSDREGVIEYGEFVLPPDTVVGYKRRMPLESG